MATVIVVVLASTYGTMLEMAAIVEARNFDRTTLKMVLTTRLAVRARARARANCVTTCDSI
jgi:hypothetical protein